MNPNPNPNPNPSSSDAIDGGEISTGGQARRATSGGKLAGKVAVITGGTSGIGLATAKLFAAQGARVLATGTSEDSVAAARTQLGPGVQVVRSDAADPAEVRALFENVGRGFGALDVLFINAGIVRNAPLTALDDAVFDEVMRSPGGPFLALKYAAPLLRAGSAVVVNTSVANRLGVPNAGAYSASKAAARALVRRPPPSWSSAACESTRSARARRTPRFTTGGPPSGGGAAGDPAPDVAGPAAPPGRSRRDRARRALSGLRRLILHHR